MEMKELGVWQKSVYVFLYSSNLIGWIISLLYADIYYKFPTNRNLIPLVVVIVILLIHWGICLKFAQLVSKALPQYPPKDIWLVQSILYVVAVILTVTSGLRLVKYII